jgi:hypothetical protein
MPGPRLSQLPTKLLPVPAIACTEYLPFASNLNPALNACLCCSESDVSTPSEFSIQRYRVSTVPTCQSTHRWMAFGAF